MDNYEPVTSDEYKRIMNILMANQNKSFVKRILNPAQYPTIDQGDGRYATHKMAWGEANGKYYAFPTVLYVNGKLRDYGDKAWGEVLKTGNTIEFNTPQDAEWFSSRYKGAWGGKMNTPPK